MLGRFLATYYGYCRAINSYYLKRYDPTVSLWFTYFVVSLTTWMNLMFIIDGIVLLLGNPDCVGRLGLTSVFAISLCANLYPIIGRRSFLRPSYRSLSSMVTVSYIAASFTLFLFTSSLVRSHNIAMRRPLAAICSAAADLESPATARMTVNATADLRSGPQHTTSRIAPSLPHQLQHRTQMRSKRYAVFLGLSEQPIYGAERIGTQNWFKTLRTYRPPGERACCSKRPKAIFAKSFQ